MRKDQLLRLTAVLLCTCLLTAIGRRRSPSGARAPRDRRTRDDHGHRDVPPATGRGAAPAGGRALPVPVTRGALVGEIVPVPRRPGQALDRPAPLPDLPAMPQPRSRDPAVRAAARYGAALARAVEGVSWGWLELGERQVRRNIEGLNRLTRSRSAAEFTAIQGDLVREGVAHMIEDGRALAELSLRAADEAGRALRSPPEEERRPLLTGPSHAGAGGTAPPPGV